MKRCPIRECFIVALLCLTVINNRQMVNATNLDTNAPFRCPGAPFLFPVDSGVIGWLYRDPASTDPSGLHSGIDVFASGGSGSPIYALADGVVSRPPGSQSIDILYTAQNVESYVAHLSGITLHLNDAVKGGQTIIGYQQANHVHISVGLFKGYDDQNINEVQDPSQFFGASLNYDKGAREDYSKPFSGWCNSNSSPPSQPYNLSFTATGQTSIHLTWQETDGVDSFKIYRDNAPQSPLGTVSGSTHQFDDSNTLSCGTPYWYHVSAIKNGVESNRGDLPARTADCISSSPCPGPSLTSPSNDYVSNSNSVNFSWNAPSGCTFQGYTFRVKNTSNMDSGGTTIIDTGDANTSQSETINGWDNQDLYWGVRTANPLSPNWSVRHFRIQPGSGCGSAPSLGSPADGQTVNNRSVTFSWSPPSGCSPGGYTFRINTSSDPEGQPMLVDTGESGTSHQYTFSGDGTYYWHVRTCQPCTPYQPGAWATARVVIQPISPQDNAQALTGPYNPTLNPGQQYTYDIKFQNNGTTTWRTSDGYVLENVDSNTPHALGNCDGLTPGSWCNWPFTLSAGTNSATWHYRMAHGSAQYGDTITINITINTPTPTNTATPTPSSTPSPTLTPSPTNTTIAYTPGCSSDHAAAFVDAYNRVGDAAGIGAPTQCVGWLDPNHPGTYVTYQNFAGSVCCNTSTLVTLDQPDDTPSGSIPAFIGAGLYTLSLVANPAHGVPTSDMYGSGSTWSQNFTSGVFTWNNGASSFQPWPTTFAGWKAEYWDRPTSFDGQNAFVGPPTYVGDEPNITYDWGTNGPASGHTGVWPNHFSARWTRTVDFAPGSYTFSMGVGDGGRLLIDGTPVIGQWHSGNQATYTWTGNLAGSHSIEMDYYQNSDRAVANLSWAQNSTATGTPPNTGTTTPLATESNTSVPPGSTVTTQPTIVPSSTNTVQPTDTSTPFPTTTPTPIPPTPTTPPSPTAPPVVPTTVPTTPVPANTSTPLPTTTSAIATATNLVSALPTNTNTSSPTNTTTPLPTATQPPVQPTSPPTMQPVAPPATLTALSPVQPTPANPPPPSIASTATPAVPTETTSGGIIQSSPPQKPTHASTKHPTLPLTISGVLSRMQSGSAITIRIHTRTRAQINGLLQIVIVTKRTSVTGAGTHRRQHTWTVVLYHVTGHGLADKHGQFIWKLHVAYHPAKPMPARLTITASLKGWTTKSSAMNVTLVPQLHKR